MSRASSVRSTMLIVAPVLGFFSGRLRNQAGVPPVVRMRHEDRRRRIPDQSRTPRLWTIACHSRELPAGLSVPAETIRWELNMRAEGGR